MVRQSLFVRAEREGADRIARLLMTLVEKEFHLVVTHGNGPQVGALLLQQERAAAETPAMPLDVLVAMTEGSLGYILQQSLLNELRRREVRRYVVTVVTQVMVDPDDPAFDAPTKPVGPFMTATEARAVQETVWTQDESIDLGANNTFFATGDVTSADGFDVCTTN